MIMGNFKKVYIGAIESEQEAAYLYDKIAIIIHGLKVTLSFIILLKWYSHFTDYNWYIIG